MGWNTTFNGDKSGLDTKAVNNWLRLRLFKNSFTPDKNSVLGDFTECDFSGYGERTLSWDPSFVNATPRAQKNAASETFVRDVGPTSNDVYGAYLVDGSNVVTAWIKFAAPVSMAVVGVDNLFIQFSPTEDTAP